jgi:hypothetical protein
MYKSIPSQLKETNRRREIYAPVKRLRSELFGKTENIDIKVKRSRSEFNIIF